MKLYHQVDRVFNELEALGIMEGDAVDVKTLSQFDQYHYLGTDAVDQAIQYLNLKPNMEVLEVGSGIGGPSRYLSQVCGCHLTALELQPDLNQIAIQLTQRCHLADRVTHLCADILDGPPEKEYYDALVSWLTFLHIPDRKSLYKQCYDALKPGAGIYVEDYYERGNLTTQERDVLSREVFCNHVPSMDDYARRFADAGFENIELVDVSNIWTEFVSHRNQVFEGAWDRNTALHGVALVTELQVFYSAIVALFQGGNLGGICVAARKPK